MSRLRHYAVLALSLIGLAGLIATYPGGVGAAPESESFSTPGTFEWVVPDGVTSVTVDAFGAAGGGVLYPSSPVPGGQGGRTRATISVTPGETLQVNVGGEGDSYDDDAAALGGFNGGGDAGSFGAGAGGGASDVRRGGTDLENRVVVAGGGGGAAGGGPCDSAVGGAGGGDVPTAGEPSDGAGGGQPGGADAGGAGGTAGAAGLAGDSGTAGAGGKGATSLGAAGGGGGGGWFGGGGGGGVGDPFSEGAAGGGGAAYVSDDATDVTYENGTRAGDGLVVISWEVPPTTTTEPDPATGGDPVADPATPDGPVATYLDGTSALQVVAGEVVDLQSAGWQPASTVTVTMHSDPLLLGSVVTSAQGSFQSGFVVPADAAPGVHALVLEGTAASGGATFVELRLEVLARTDAAPSSLSFVC
jgi:hypothetical protein